MAIAAGVGGCVCTSIRPGTAVSPVASRMRAPGGGAPPSTPAIRSPSIRTLATRSRASPNTRPPTTATTLMALLPPQSLVLCPEPKSGGPTILCERPPGAWHARLPDPPPAPVRSRPPRHRADHVRDHPPRPGRSRRPPGGHDAAERGRAAAVPRPARARRAAAAAVRSNRGGARDRPAPLLPDGPARARDPARAPPRDRRAARRLHRPRTHRWHPARCPLGHATVQRARQRAHRGRAVGPLDAELLA